MHRTNSPKIAEMKKLASGIVLPLVTIFSLLSACKESDHSKPVMKSSESSSMASAQRMMDAGVVKPSESFEYSFDVECLAAGVFEKAVASCSCSSIELHQKDHRLEVGKRLKFTTTIKTSEEQKDSRLSIQFLTVPPDCIAPVQIVYHVRSNLFVQPATFAFGSLLEGRSKSFAFRVENWGEVPSNDLRVFTPEMPDSIIETHLIASPKLEYGSPIQAWLCSVSFMVPSVASGISNVRMVIQPDTDGLKAQSSNISFTPVAAARLGPSKIAIQRNTESPREVFLMIDAGIELESAPQVEVQESKCLNVEISTTSSHLFKLRVGPSVPWAEMPDQTVAFVHVGPPVNQALELEVIVRN